VGNVGVNTEAMKKLQQGDDRFLIDGTVDGKSCSILLDSGAAVSVIRKDCVQPGNLGSRMGFHLRAANGNHLQVRGLKICRIRIRDVIRRVKCYIVDELTVPCILGVDGLRIMGVSMKFSEESLEVNIGSIETEKLDIGTAGSSEGADAVRKLVVDNAELFGPVIPGAARGVEHTIDLFDESPVVCRGKRVPLKDALLIEEHVKEMLKDGVISHSKSAYRFPVVLATKKDGKRRFCINFSRLNDITVKDKHPLPYIDDLIDKTHGSRFFTVLDQSSAYWQIRMAEKDKEKTAFSTGSGHYHFNVMPFGLSNAPATQQAYMRKVLHGMKGVDVMLDDIIIYSKDEKSHIKMIETVFNRLKENNIRLKVSKCHFFQESIRYLGYIVGFDGRRVDPDKTKAIDDFPAPRTIKELRTFLGMATYCRKFIKSFATIASPLFDLTRKNVSWSWSPECEQAFNDIKRALKNPPVLATPDINLPYRLYTDASNTARGAALCQIQGGKERVIAYASQHFNDRERKYSTIEKEAAAMVWAIDVFNPYLKGARFRIYSDHAPLKWLAGKTNATGRLGRWQIRIMECDGLDGVEYLKGSDNCIADALSRIPEILVLDPEDERISSSILREMQEKDSGFCRRNFTLRRGVWFFGNRVFIPDALKKRFFITYHGRGVHFGVGRTLDLMKQGFYFPNMDSYVRSEISKCDFCNQAKNTPGRKMVPVSMTPPKFPFQRISMDYAGPMPRTKLGNRYFLVIVDQFSRYLKVFPTKEASSQQTVKCLEQVFAEEGVPEEVMSDNGTHFVSSFVKQFLRKHGVQQVLSPPYHPESNGLAERNVRTVKTFAKAALLEKGTSWDVNLYQFQLKYNAGVHPSTGKEPFAVVRGRTPRLPLPWLDVPVEVNPTKHDWSSLLNKSEEKKLQQNANAGGKTKGELSIGDKIFGWRNGKWLPGVVEGKRGKLIYLTSLGTFHRNHLQIRNQEI